ncbi:ABC transporter permease [Candidatus Mycoplasma haematohominis]|uniref:ABC transporter permease n=1 Tax=Candidatus Mycoplasma haematohominis TaxID=1494318 RepID=UPI001C0A6A6B|nr:ABC transporter permease [Candidatus Mycoplasma haemohominis]
MGFLFKTTLIHVKKNLAVVSVLGFFVAFGTSVLSSVDLLSSNLNKGFHEINYDSNPHDLVLLSKLFKPSQELKVNPTFETELSKVAFTPKWGYKWSFDSNKENGWVKTKDAQTKSSQEGSSGGVQISGNDKLSQTAKLVFTIPHSEAFAKYSYNNWLLVCSSSSSFVSEYSREIQWLDRNNSTFNPVQGPSQSWDIFDLETPFSSQQINSGCFDGSFDRYHYPYFSSFLFSVYGYYQQGIAKSTLKNDNGGQTINATDEKSNGVDEKADVLEADEIAEVHRKLSAFNPKRFWKNQIGGKWTFMHLFESDFFLAFRLPFKNNLAGKDISKKFKQLVQNMKSREIFYRLDEGTRQSVNSFVNSNEFETLNLKFYLTSFNDALNEFSFWLPMIPGMTYKETSILLLKLVLWDILSKGDRVENLIEKLKWSGEIKNNLEKIVESLDENAKGLSDWNIFEKFQEGVDGKRGEKDKKPTDAASYLFSVLEANKKINELTPKNETIKKAGDEFQEFKSSDNGNGDTEFCTQNGDQCSNLGYQDSDTLVKAVKSVFGSWIKGEYRQPSKTNGEKFIPSFNKDSHKKFSTASTGNNNGKKPFQKTGDNYEYYRTYPDDFKTVYEQLVERVIFKSLSHYLTSVEIENLKTIKKFISEHEIFTLTFLLQNFNYDPNLQEKNRKRIQDLNDSNVKYSSISTFLPQKASDNFSSTYEENDYSPSVNYHKSLVVFNSSSTSSKLNDPSKKNHAFKIISQERKDDAYVNRIKVISGNPLFDASIDNVVDFKKIAELETEPNKHYIITRKLLPAFKLLSRAKFSNPKHKRLFTRYFQYFGNERDETWENKAWITYEDLEAYRRIYDSVIQSSRNIVTQGSKLFFSLSNFETIYFLRTFDVHSDVMSLQSPAYIDQFSAYFTIISPDYAAKNGIKPISNQQYAKFKKIVESGDTTQEEWEKEYSTFVMNPANHDSIVNVNGNKLIVVGTGISPDMLLPTHSFLNLVPNKEKEALIFVDKFGYRNVKYNSLSAWDEYYLSLSYPQIVKDLSIEKEYKSQLENFMTQFLLGGNAGEVVNTEFDLFTVKDADSLKLVFLRSNYVDYFLGATHAISWTLLAFMGVIIFFTVWVLIKKYIASSINIFGIFVANGITRKQIILNSFSFILIPALIGSLFGYFVALGLQPTLFSMVSDIWYLKPVFSGFNLSTMLYYVLITLGTLAPLSWISAYWMMKDDVSQLMKVNVAFKHNKATELIYKLFKNASSLWKFRASVIMNTINRGLILSSATVFLFVFSSFLFNNLGQFQAVSNFELATKDYGFDIALETPSIQSGQPHLSSYTNLGDSFMNRIPHSKKVPYQKTTKGEWGVEEIKFNKDNPELVASGLYSAYIPKDLESFYTTCSDKLKMNDWYKKLGTFDFNYPAHVFNKTPYNVYMFGNSLTKKENVEIDCQKDLSEYFTRSEMNLPIPDVDSTKVFYSSRKKFLAGDGTSNSEDNRKFKVDDSDANAKELKYLGDYVPIKNELRKKSAANGKSNAGGNGDKEYEMIKYGNEPLFKPLIDYYKNNKELKITNANVEKLDGGLQSYTFWKKNGANGAQVKTKNGGSDGKPTKKGEDFLSFKNGNSGGQDQTHDHPTLRRLFKDQANYWLFSYQDLKSVIDNPVFFRNKVIMPMLFNHDWTLQLFGKTLRVNPWNEFSEFFSKYSTELMSAMESNYVNYINEIIKSRYGAFFVNRFMTKHEAANHNINHAPGKLYYQKPTWKVTNSIVAKENKSQIEEGLYWFDAEKIIYFYDKLKSIDQLGSAKPKDPDSNSTKHPERFIIFRPDFLYLFFALSKDEHFLKPEIAPMKISFHQNVYTPDYSKPFEEWSISGDAAADSALKKGLTSEYKDVSNEEYEKTPNGDQTYTYLNVLFSGSNKLSKIIGLKQDPRGSYVKLNKDGKNINHKLYANKFDDGSYPVIINHFTAKKLYATLGSTLEVSIVNTIDRFVKRMQGDNSHKKVKLRVVDIYDSYYNDSFYISQKHANEIIGLDPDYGYNGIYTNKQTSSVDNLPMQLIKAVSGYSSSGIYAKQKINKSSPAFLSFLDSNAGLILDSDWSSHFLHQPKNHKWIQLKAGLSDEQFGRSDQIANVLEQVYGSNYSINSSIIALENASLFNDFVFSTVSDLVLSVINLFISVFTPLLICTLLIITTLIIEDLKNLLTILNLLGFTHVENSITILLYLGLILGFSIFVAVPISSLLLSVYVDGMFKTLSIYLPIYLRFDYALLSFALLLGMFGFSYWTSMRKIKGMYLPVAMKSLNE